MARCRIPDYIIHYQGNNLKSKRKKKRKDLIINLIVKKSVVTARGK